jgi:hypothetical protein
VAIGASPVWQIRLLAPGREAGRRGGVERAGADVECSPVNDAPKGLNLSLVKIKACQAVFGLGPMSVVGQSRRFWHVRFMSGQEVISEVPVIGFAS